MRGKHNVKVFMLSPDGKMSAFQRAQMYSLQDANIFNIAVTGMFDDAQDIVKAVSNDAAFKARYKIGAVNSINWARVAAQIVYYFQGYFLATKSNDEQVAFCVPSGNFGNICAGHIARQMGLPIARLVLATNENDVLDEFFRPASIVRAPRSKPASPPVRRWIFPRPPTSSASSSIWSAAIRPSLPSYGPGLTGAQAFDLSATVHWQKMPNFGFVSGKSTHSDRIKTIRFAQGRYNVMLDTHTADGLKVALENRLPGIPMIVLETAQPAKFEETIREALGTEPVRPADLKGIENLPQRVVVMAPDVDAVKQFVVDHV